MKKNKKLSSNLPGRLNLQGIYSPKNYKKNKDQAKKDFANSDNPQFMPVSSKAGCKLASQSSDYLCEVKKNMNNLLEKSFANLTGSQFLKQAEELLKLKNSNFLPDSEIDFIDEKCVAKNKKAAIYVVATPIGNLADITIRALAVFAAADVIICEDSRSAARLLDAFGIKQKRIIVYNDQSNEESRQKILELLQKNLIAALISDAGTPLISDPGYKLLNFLRNNDFGIIPKISIIPGASSLVAALSGAGIACNQFTFFGFLPQKYEAKKNLFISLPNSSSSIFFESPNRIQKTLEILAESLPARRVCIARELTKIYEEFLIDLPKNLLEFLLKNPDKIKGEMVLIIEKSEKSVEFLSQNLTKKSEQDFQNAEFGDELSIIFSEIDKLLKEGFSAKKIAEEIAQNLGIPKKEIYRLVIQKIAAN